MMELFEVWFDSRLFLHLLRIKMLAEDFFVIVWIKFNKDSL